ncbi:hypothetical protein HW555_004564, partial [Spodoptera exigua]
VQSVTLSNILLNILPNELSTNNNVIVCCHRCATTLRRGRTPTQAFWNGKWNDEIPPELKILSNVETRLLTRIIPFVKMVKLTGRFEQHDVDEIAEQLPLRMSSAGLVIVCNQLDSVQKLRGFSVNIPNLRAWLMSNNPIYANVGNDRRILRGSFNQSHSKFNDFPRGKQCTANAAVAIAVLKIKSAETLSSDIIDSILISGDRYTSSIQSRNAPNLVFGWSYLQPNFEVAKGRVAQNGAACLISFTEITALWAVLKSNIPKSQENRLDDDHNSIIKIRPEVYTKINEPDYDTDIGSHLSSQSPSDLNNDNIVITSSVLRVIDEPILELSTVIANDNCSELPVHQLRRKTEPPSQITRERRAEELSWFYLELIHDFKEMTIFLCIIGNGVLLSKAKRWCSVKNAPGRKSGRQFSRKHSSKYAAYARLKCLFAKSMFKSHCYCKIFRQKLVNDHPVTLSRHFMIRVNAFMRLLKNDDKIFGRKLTDFWWRIKFQNSGSPHLHMLFWIKNASNFDTFEGRSLISEIYLSDETVLLGPDETLRNNGRFCTLRQHSDEQYVNNYNTPILKLWKGNMDIQSCGNVTAISYCIAKYTSKHEP